MSEMRRTSSSLSSSPLPVSSCSSSTERSKWSSMACLPRPVTIRMSWMPARTASSITYWIEGLSTSGSISLGCALVAGRKRVPSPAAGITALRTFTMAVPPKVAVQTPILLDPGGPPLDLAGAGVQGQQARPGGDDPVAALELGLVEGLVGGPQQLLGRGGVLGEAGQADGDGQPHPPTVAVAAERLAVGGPAELLGHGQAALQVGLGQDEHELLAAVAGEGVDVADAAGDPAPELDQHLVAPLVAEAIVDQLEVVDVQHEQGQDAAEAAGALDLLLEAAFEVAVVPGPGERVGDRQPLGLGVQPDVLDGHRGLDGEGGQGLGVGQGERLAVLPVVEAEHPEDASLGEQGDADLAGRGRLGRAVAGWAGQDHR